MKRFWLALVVFAAAALNQGCQSCCAPHDYDPPVADCHCSGCNTCGGGRAGSVISGSYASTPTAEYVEGEHAYVEGEMAPTE